LKNWQIVSFLMFNLQIRKNSVWQKYFR
jgi:hypothetical protein